MEKCRHDFGCHSCVETLMLLHAAIKQLRLEPRRNIEKIDKELTSVQNCIEDIVTIGENEMRGLEPCDGIPPPN